MPWARDRIVLAGAAAAALLALAGGLVHEKIDDSRRLRARAAAITGGDPRRGEARFIAYGCGSCHALDGVAGAVGRVGPGLDTVAQQAIIAGRLPNSPDAMRLWIAHPQQVSPGSAMPNMGVSDRDARDISAFLYARPD